MVSNTFKIFKLLLVQYKGSKILLTLLGTFLKITSLLTLLTKVLGFNFFKTV